MKKKTVVQLEPMLISQDEAALFLGCGQRHVDELVANGQLTRIKIPGLRRIVFDVAELRAVALKWKQQSTKGLVDDDITNDSTKEDLPPRMSAAR